MRNLKCGCFFKYGLFSKCGHFLKNAAIFSCGIDNFTSEFSHLVRNTFQQMQLFSLVYWQIATKLGMCIHPNTMMIFLIRPNISRLDSLTDVNYRSCVHKLKIVKFSKFLTQNDIWMTPEHDMTPFHLNHHCVG